jgi:alpha-D-ribose 1-methylphosphonate 5-triphosphate synthase subunit PhnG
MPMTSDTSEPLSTGVRRDWLAVLAHAPREALRRHMDAIMAQPFDWLREPETGLAMLRGRVGNGGDRFNLGEATLTRCVVRHRSALGTVSAGIGYVLGRDAERAGWIARIDALLQQPQQRDALLRDVIEPLREATAQRRAAKQARTDASRVEFFTLQPEATT